nr:hypothetical protein [Tanacetum cinerariifolium]
MGDEHLDTLPATESEISSESEGIPEHMCDVPYHGNSPPLDVSKDQIEDFSESNEEFSSTDDDSFSSDDIDYVEASPPDSELVSSEVDAFLDVEDEFPSYQFPKSYLNSEGGMLLFEAFLNDDHSSDFKTKSSSTSLNSLLEETNNFHNSLPEFTTFSNDLFDAECESDSKIIPMESLHTHDSSLPISSKIDSLLDEFAGELTLLKSILLGIDETDCDFEEDIRLIEKLLYDNSSPRPPEEFVSANSDAAIKSFSPSPILVKDSVSLIEEIDLFCTPDYPMPPSIVDKDYDSKRDILIPKDLPSNNSLSFAEQESFHFDIPPFSRPPTKPPDGDTRILNIKMMGDISDQKAFMHKLMITLASHQEKSPDLLSHRCGTVKKFNTHREAPIPPPTIPSIILENLPTFNSAFRFEERLRLLETSFNEYRQTNQVPGAVSAILGIIHQYMDKQMKEAVREAVQKQTDQLQDSLQRENDEFLRNIDENMKNVLKGLVKTQVKEQVSRILPRVEESVNATLEAEVLTRSSHSSRTSYAVAADLSEMELKKILIEKMEGNKSIKRFDEQRNLYKALVEAYEADKAILDTYGESTILKRRREDDDQEGPSAGPNRGSKRQKEGGEQ